MVLDPPGQNVFRYTNRFFSSVSLRPAGQGQGEEESECGEDRDDQHGQMESSRIGNEPEQRSADTAEPDGEAHRDTGCEPDAAWQVLLPHDHRDAESSHGSRTD